LAIIPPIKRKIVLTRGVAFRSPAKNIPPEMIKRDPSNIIKEKYSLIECHNCSGNLSQRKIMTGILTIAPRMALFRFLSQNFPHVSGMTAIKSRKRIKGRQIYIGIVSGCIISA
jgi:hypothetical protein